MTEGVVRGTAGAPTDAARVALRIAEFLVRTERQRVGLFHDHLRATVTRVSPLLVELAIMEGVPLGAVVELIHPPRDWPWRPLHDHPPDVVRRMRRIKGWPASRREADAKSFLRAFENPGVVVREADHPRGRFAVRPCGGVLGFAAAIGPCVLVAFGASATLRLPEPLPETLTMSLPGRLLDQVVDHPLFRDRGYRISRVVVADEAGEGPELVLRVPLVPFAMPLPAPRDPS